MRNALPIKSYRNWLSEVGSCSQLMVSASIGAVAGTAIARIDKGPAAIAAVLGLTAALAIPLEALFGLLLFVRNLAEVTAQGSTDATSSSAAPTAIGLVILVCVPIRAIAVRSSPRNEVVTVVSGLLAAWCVLAVITYGTDSSILREFARVLSILAIGLLGSVVTSQTSERRVAWLIVLSLVVPAVIAIFQIIGVLEASASRTSDGLLYRAPASFSHPNAAAAAFGIGVALSVWLVMTSAGRSRRAATCLLVLFSLGLLSTSSVGGIGATVVALLIIASLGGGGSRLKWLAWVAAVGLAIVFIATPAGTERLNDLRTTKSYSEAATGSVSNSLDWRYLNWSQYLESWREQPVLGHGLGTTVELIRPLGKGPHNEAVRLLVETGVLGLALALLGIGILARALLYRVRENPMPPTIALPTLAIIIGFLVHSVSNTITANTAAMFMIASLVGCALSSSVRSGKGV